MFVELKCKSNFSFLRGASDSREYMMRAAELQMPAIAITDLNGVYGIPRAWEVVKESQDLKLIVGAELTLSDHPNLTLLARDRGAYAMLCRAITQLHHGKPKGEGTLRLEELLDLLGADPRSQGLIALPDLAEKTALGVLKDSFGSRLYLPLCQYLDGLDEERVESVLGESAYYGIPVIATNDVHYHLPSRKRLQDCLTCVREGVTLKTAGRKLFKNNERYLKSPLQMRALFRELPGAIRETCAIAESCTFKLSELRFTYPVELIPPGLTAQTHLEELVLKGAQDIYRGMIPSAVDNQIRKELRLIDKLGFASYFLTIHDVVDFARSRKIICQGRGSAANSIVCYCLKVTAVDPVRMNLLSERFISEGRGEPPDIDVDFEHERREEVIQFIYRRYGRHRAAMVSAVRTYRQKSAFLELSKAFGVDVGTVSANVLERDFDQLAGELAAKKPLLEEVVGELLDFPRHLSIHSGGFTLSHDPIIETVPVEPARMDDRTIIQWDKNDIDTVGLLKLDILGLGFLCVLSKASQYLGIDWREIPPEDRATYDMICRGDTLGTFQIESRAQISMLPRTRPRTFYDLVVQVAIVRPGPGMGSMIAPYLERREASRRGRPYILPDPELEPILGRTYGIPLFQEQAMSLSMARAGFSEIEADQLRRSIAAVRSVESVDLIGKKLREGLMKSGLPVAWIEELCGYFSGFAHYNFPESHAASFAHISYVSAYLKCHHPAELLCALVNSQPMGFYAVDTLINDAKRKGVRVLPIHPNFSDWDARIEGKGGVRMGFRNVRRIREEDVRGMSASNERELRESDFAGQPSNEEMHGHFLVLEAEREKGHFTSLYDFMRRTKFSREVIELMSMANVFSCFGQDRRHTFWQSIAYQAMFERADAAQLSLFTSDPLVERALPIFEEMTLFQTIAADYRALGYSTDGNIMTAIRKARLDLPQLTSVQAKRLRKGADVHYVGILTVNQRPPTAKGVAFLTVEDEEGSLDFIVKKEIYEEFEQVIRNNRFLELRGKIQRRDEEGSVSVLLYHAAGFLVEGASDRSIEHGTTSRGFGSPVGVT